LINKADLPQRLIPDERLPCPILASALTGKGIDELRGALVRHAGADDRMDGALVLRERQRIALERAAAAVAIAITSLSESRPPDLIAVDIMIALDHLGEIVGHTSAEAVLDRIFSEFCIGK
jgi:tRNA modification GTPase